MEDFIRTKSSSSTKIIHDEEKDCYVVSKKIKKETYDAVLHQWVSPQYRTQILPLSSLGKDAPRKEIETTILLLKPLLNCVDEKLIPFKEKIGIEVIPDAKNIFIKETSMGFLQECLATGQACPLTFSCKYVRITRGKKQQISDDEFNLLKRTYKVFHESPRGELSVQVTVPQC